MTQADALFHLQDIDLSLTQIQKRLSEIEAALGDKGAVDMAQNQLDAAEKILTPLQKKVRNLELEIQSNADKIRLTDEQLYSGRIRNPKELQDMQQEIQSLKKRNSELEDTLLETMMDVESAETVVQQQQTELRHATSQWEGAHQGLLDEQVKLKADYQFIRPRREQALTEVTPESLKVYNTLRPRKNNQPVALLVGESCSVCRVEQDMSIIAEVRKGQKLTFCLSCGRILASKRI
jgi:uncharacterized protein